MRIKIKKKILAMLAAASLVFAPSAIQAQNITKTDPSKAGTITVDGRVTNITPDRTNSKRRQNCYQSIFQF